MTRSGFVLAAVFIGGGGLLWLALTSHSRLSGSGLNNPTRIGFLVGDQAPDVDLRSPDGSSFKLAELRGKAVLLNFWATWCAPCRVEMPWLVELDEKYRDRGLRIIGVSMDDVGDTQEVVAFAKERGVKYQVLLGDSATADAYGGVRFMPQTFFIDSDGKITKATTGLTGQKDLENGVKALLPSLAGAQDKQGIRQ
jgi:peroxiredoxin